MLKGTRVLLVSPQRPAREQTAAVLRDAGAAVREAGSAQVALLLLQDEPADLMVADLVLPDVDGYSLIEAVRRLREVRIAAIPAVALSDHATDAERQRALVSGYQLHMMRPVDPKGLALTLAGLRRVAAPAG